MNREQARTYLGVAVARPKAAFFEFTSCEGCQLQLLNNEATLLDFLDLLDIVTFREAMTEHSDVYDIAFVEGSISRADEIERLQHIRGRAGILVAFGSCACFGGVNQLKNRFSDQEWVKREVYQDFPIQTDTVQPLSTYVSVDLEIYGCPVRKEEIEKIVTNLVLGKAVRHPAYPVCMECKAKENICLFERGELCVGPVTRGGCEAWCPDNGMGCWGCRGPAEDANIEELAKIMERHNISHERFLDRLECFGGFKHYIAKGDNT